MSDKNLWALRRQILPVALAAALVACGGGGSSDTTTGGGTGGGGGGGTGGGGGGATATTLAGTAATGAPIIGTVVAIDANGQVSAPATTSADGAYTLDVAGLTAPFLITVTGTSNGNQVFLTSLATAAGQTVNITPLTDLVVSTAAGVPAAGVLTEACTPAADGSVTQACRDALAAATTGTRLTEAVAAVQALVAPLNTGNVDVLNGAFVANGTGFDALLDKILVAPAPVQGATATVTLIGSNATLGQVTLPATAGATATVDNQSAGVNLTAADEAATVLSEIRSCMASFNALYPTSNFTAPSANAVSPFVDDSFLLAGISDKATAVSFFSSGESPAVAGFKLVPAALSTKDMTPFSSDELAAYVANTSSAPFGNVWNARPNNNSPILRNGDNGVAAAWVRMAVNGSEIIDFKMVKGAAYSGCAGGWRMAGTQHLDMHMNARVARNGTGDTATYTRSLAVHLEREAVASAFPSANVDTAIVGGSGIVAYSGNASAPVGNATRVVLTLPADPLQNTFVIAGGNTFYGNGESLLSCTDLAAQLGNTGAGTPCIDETRAVPGTNYGWIFKSGGAQGTTVAAFPFQIRAVPLSEAFARANAANLFATLTQATPASVSAVNAAIAAFPGTVLDDVFSFNYTVGSAYGATMDNCHLWLYGGVNNGTLLMNFEGPAPASSCTLNSARQYSGSLAKPDGTVTQATVSLAVTALGNQLTSAYSLP